MYKVTLKQLHEAYMKGYVDAIQGKPSAEDVNSILESVIDPEITGVFGIENDFTLQSWQTEIINKEIEDFYEENHEQ